MLSLFQVKRDQTVLDSSLFSEDHLVQTIYRFASHKDEWFNLLLTLSNCIGLAEKLPNAHPFQEVTDRIKEHLLNAIRISSQLSVGAFDDHAVSVLNKLPHAALIIDGRGRVVDLNEQATKELEQSRTWTIEDKLLTVRGIRWTEALSQLGDKRLSLPLDSHRRAFVTKLPGSEEGLSFRYYVCFESSPEGLVNMRGLKTEFGLTETEALVVEAVVEHVSTQKTAKQLKLKDATVREHLSHIYQKMGVSRRPEMIQKVLLQGFIGCTHGPLTILGKESYCPHMRISLLSDGRRLSYLDYQHDRTVNPEHTILLLHNLMGSGYELPPGSQSLLKSKNIRVLVPERPGYGLSDPMPGRTHLDWCKDIENLLDELGIEDVYVMAHSVGGAYALALAEYLPKRIKRIAMVNSVARVEDMKTVKPVPILFSAVTQSLRFAPFLIEPVLKMAMGKSVEHFYQQQINFIRPTLEGRAADINLLRTPEYRVYSIQNIKQSCLQGISAWVDEIKLSFTTWEFEPKNRQVEYLFWHGEHDDVISIKAAERLASQVNTKKFYTLNNETHFLFARQFNTILTELIRPDTGHPDTVTSINLPENIV